MVWARATSRLRLVRVVLQEAAQESATPLSKKAASPSVVPA